MPVETVVRRVDFPAHEPLRIGHRAVEDFIPFAKPAQVRRHFAPKAGRVVFGPAPHPVVFVLALDICCARNSAGGGKTRDSCSTLVIFSPETVVMVDLSALGCDRRPGWARQTARLRWRSPTILHYRSSIECGRRLPQPTPGGFPRLQVLSKYPQRRIRKATEFPPTSRTVSFRGCLCPYPPSGQ